MSQDAMDHLAKQPRFSKKQKREYAEKKSAEEESKELHNPKVVKETSKKFRDKVSKDLKSSGLEDCDLTICEKCKLHIGSKKDGTRFCDCGNYYIDDNGNRIMVNKPLPEFVDTQRFDTIDVKVDLTMDEKNAAGQELAHKKQQLDQVDVDRKSRMAAFKDQLDEIKARMSDLSNKVTLGYEYRKFSCRLYLDFVNNVRIYKDRDTGRELAKRPLEADDYQMRLPL